MYQHVKHSGWGIHWNDINTGRLILQYFGPGRFAPRDLDLDVSHPGRFSFGLFGPGRFNP